MVKKSIFVSLFLMFILSLAACGGDTESSANSAMDHTHVEAPSEFTSLKNPFADDDDALAMGKAVFETNCVTCHGTEGKGDGPAAVGLEPGPADLSDGGMLSMLSDGYLFWRVSQGGAVAPFNSAMPSWEGILTDDQRWQVITYVRLLSGDMEMDLDMEHNDDHGSEHDHEH